MEGFRTFTQAMDRASDYCDEWMSVEDNTVYRYIDMMILAAHIDTDYPLDKNTWFIVFPDGEIALMNTHTDEMIAMYRPRNKRVVKEKFTGEELERPRARFCRFCGSQITAEAKFCPYCGKKVN